MDIALINGENIDMLNKTIVKSETKNLLLLYESNRFFALFSTK